MSVNTALQFISNILYRPAQYSQTSKAQSDIQICLDFQRLRKMVKSGVNDNEIQPDRHKFQKNDLATCSKKEAMRETSFFEESISLMGQNIIRRRDLKQDRSVSWQCPDFSTQASRKPDHK